MDERTFEIILSRYPEGLLPDGWTLEGQQIGVTSGILDLLFRDRQGRRHLVELKKGPATVEAVEQVLRYADALSQRMACTPWVVAHEVPRSVARHALALGVNTLAITPDACELALARRGMRLNQVVPLRRRTPGALTGGAGDVWSAVDNAAAYAMMPKGMAAILRTLQYRQNFTLSSGKIQTVIRYRGVKLGGVNRKVSPHGYIAGGVVAGAEVRAQLERLGFRWMEKPQARSAHVHTWYQVPINRHDAFAAGIEAVVHVVDEALGPPSQ